MTQDQWLGALIAMVVTSTLTVLLMQVIKKYDPSEKVKRFRVLIMIGVSLASALFMFLAGIFPINHIPVQAAFSFSIAALFHSLIFNAVKKKIVAKSKDPS